MSKGFASNYRIVLLATGLFACFGGLGARLVWLHVINREELLHSITKAREQVIVEKARRGDILDRNGNILATSRPLILVALDPWSLREEDRSKYPKLARLLELSDADLQKKIANRYYAPAPAINASAPAVPATPGGIVFKLGAAPVEDSADAETDAAEEERGLDSPDDAGLRRRHWIKLSDSVSEATYTEIDKLGIRGLCPPERTYRRVYPHGQLASHVIGYVNKSEQPATGIEHFADFYLRGQDGWRESEKDGTGRRELAQFRSREVPRANGYNVMLSLDANVQDIVERELAMIAQRFQPEKATIIVSDPRTGFILGMGNYPTFDLNEYSKVPKEAQASMKNIAVTDILEPGSTFKMVSVSAGLEEGVIVPTDKFDCSLEKITYKGKVLSLPGEAHHFDHPLTISEIVARSSNRGAAQVGMKLGEQRLYNYARAFGFARTLGFPGAHESPGMLKNPETNPWNDLDITRIPMGHTVAATALQMHMAMSTIANDGVLLRPQIIREIKDAAGESVYSYEKAELGRAVSHQTAQTMARMLMGVALKEMEGTAPQAAIPGYEVAGKTGTTQMIVDGKYSDKHHVASFVGFFPASNPQIAITVIVHDADAHTPSGVAAGASVAAPSFKHIGEQLIPYRGITAPPPEAPAVRPTLAYEGVRR